MKYLFKPLVDLSNWIGKMVRFLWHGKAPVNRTEMILHPEIKPVEERKNKIAGSVTLGIVAVVVAVWGILIGPTHNDVKRLEAKMTDSFNRMEMLDLLVPASEISSSDSTLAYYQQQRGKLKMMATLLNQQMVFHEEYAFNSEREDIVKVAENAKDIMLTYLNIHSHIMTNLKEIAQYQIMHQDKEASYVDWAYMLQWEEMLNECDDLLIMQETEKNHFVEKMGDIVVNDNLDKRKLAKVCKQSVNSKNAIMYKVKVYEMIDILYEYTITKQLYLIYGKTQNNSINTKNN